MDTRKCASKDVGRQREVNWGVPHQLENGMSASETLGSERRLIVRSHVGLEEE